jgi:membrane associated rhomboid family serine protease
VKAAWRIWSFLPRGVREPLALSLIVGVIGLAGSYSGAINLYAPLALWPSEFWRGHVWQAATYPLLPFGLADLLVNGFFFAMLGTRLVQVWGRWPFWRFCFVAVLGTAAVKLMLSPLNRSGLVGISGVIYAMLAAWYRLFANEEVCLMGMGQMRMKTAVFIIGALNSIFSLLCPCGFWNALATLGGALTGWLYLAAQSHWVLRQDAQPLPSQRISRLEL